MKIYLMAIIFGFVLTALYLKGDQLWGRVDTAMLKSSYEAHCLNAELEVDNCNDWANTIVFEWPDAAQECSDAYLGNTDAMSICITGFMIDSLDETFMGNGE